MPICPDCGTTLERRTHLIGDRELPYWACPRCHDEPLKDAEYEFTDLADMKRYRYAYRDGHFLVVPKEEPK